MNEENDLLKLDFDKVYIWDRRWYYSPKEWRLYLETEGEIHKKSHFSGFAVSEPDKTVRTHFSKNKPC